MAVREETGKSYFGIDFRSNTQAGSPCFAGNTNALRVTIQPGESCDQLGALWGSVELALHSTSS